MFRNAGENANADDHDDAESVDKRNDVAPYNFMIIVVVLILDCFAKVFVVYNVRYVCWNDI